MKLVLILCKTNIGENKMANQEQIRKLDTDPDEKIDFEVKYSMEAIRKVTCGHRSITLAICF